MIKEDTDNIKILFFGLGSIGKRHLNIIKKNYKFNIYCYTTGRGQEKNNVEIIKYKNIEDAFSKKPNIAFITNPTNLHVETALKCVKRNIDLFIEKPISHSFSQINELKNEIEKRKIFTYVAYNMRFHPVIIKLKKMLINGEKPIYFRVVNSSYLPDWRSNQDYTKSYSAKKNQGGGVILDLSHEFDYISWIFGRIKNLEGTYGKISNLKIDSEDFLSANITCESKIKGNLYMDYYGKKTERKIMIYFNTKYIEADLIKNSIRIFDNNNKKIIKFKCTNNETYKKQIDYFFKQYFIKNYSLMNNFSEALILFNKIMGLKKKSEKIDG